MRIRAPFAFSAYGRFRPSRNYVTKFFLANTVVDVPTIDRLPPPVCSVAELDNPERRIDWYEIEGVLMRPVMCRDQPATLYDIEAATDILVVGQYATESWLHSPYGLKIIKAKAMQDKGHHVAIVPEQHWAAHL